MTAGVEGIRLPIVARIGTREWASFHVDLVGEQAQMTGVPDDVHALARVGLADVPQADYRVWPLVDHIADKVAATLDTYGDQARSSTRIKDLIDLVILARSSHVEADALHRAIETQSRRRGIDLPTRFAVPELVFWRPRYASAVRNLAEVEPQSLESALELVGAFIDPVLQGTARGSWDPIQLCWG